MEIKEKAKLSSRTLSKHLKRMTDIQIIEKKRDVKSGEYPIPVFYRAKRELITYLEFNISELKKRIAELESLMLPVTRLFYELTETTPEEETEFEQRLREKELRERELES